jgi:hypothetical protein
MKVKKNVLLIKELKADGSHEMSIEPTPPGKSGVTANISIF